MNSSIRLPRSLRSLALLSFVVMWMLAGLVLASPRPVYADHGRTAGECSRLPDAADRQECQEHAGGIPPEDRYEVEADCDPDNGNELNASNCGIVYYLELAINVLSALVGIAVVVMIIVGGIQYSASRNDPGLIQAAKQRIRNAVLALILYIFMWSFLQWLIPGGVL